MAEFYYDDSRLMQMFEALEPKRRATALRGAFRQAAQELRKKVLTNLRQSGLGGGKAVERGVRAVVWKRSLGFRVTIGTKKRKVDYSGLSSSERRSKAYKEKLAIVPLWAEGGTHDRQRRGGGRTGAMPAYLFMEKTKASQPQMEETLKRKIVENIEKTAKKYGGTFR